MAARDEALRIFVAAETAARTELWDHATETVLRTRTAYELPLSKTIAL